MDPLRLTSPTEVKQFLAAHDFAPSKSLGQNFLIDANIRDLIVSAAAIQPEDTVLEIGPGLGVLTEALLQKARRVISVERDQRLYALLAERFRECKTLELVQADALAIDLETRVRDGATRMVSNLPYSVGTRILMELIGARPRPECMVVTVQRDVADRMTALHGNKTYGLLSIATQVRYEVHLEKVIKPTCFYPAPRVDSAVVRLVRRAEPVVNEDDWKSFLAAVKKAFSQRRKQLGTIFKQELKDTGDTGFDLHRRPETLSVEEWAGFAGELTAK